MQFGTEEVDGVVIVMAPELDLDAGKADEFKRQAVLIVEGHSRVVMDLGSIGFMDSAGLGAILSIFKKIRGDGGQFRVYGLNKEVRALFDLVRMQRLFEVCEDKEAAVNASKA